MDHLFYCYSEIIYMFVADNEDGFLVYIKIMMADDVSKRLCFFPIHLGGNSATNFYQCVEHLLRPVLGILLYATFTRFLLVGCPRQSEVENFLPLPSPAIFLWFLFQMEAIKGKNGFDASNWAYFHRAAHLQRSQVLAWLN